MNIKICRKCHRVERAKRWFPIHVVIESILVDIICYHIDAINIKYVLCPDCK